MPKKSTSLASRKSSTKTHAPVAVLYLYAISRMPEKTATEIAAEGIDGAAVVEAIRCGNYLCWVSHVSKADFADQISERMQDLEWLATAGLRHQHVVAEISSKFPMLPARFGTIFVSEESLAKHMKQRGRGLRDAFQLVADADEWGVKVFVVAAAKAQPTKAVASGSEYLKRKADLLQPRTAGKLDKDVQTFVSSLKKLAIAHSVGGKASAGQPGLVWHGSFLIRRKDRKKLDSVLQKYAAQWKDVRRIDCSGPWPPYSFVGNHAD
jgi:hypothetical protein